MHVVALGYLAVIDVSLIFKRIACESSAYLHIKLKSISFTVDLFSKLIIREMTIVSVQSAPKTVA